MFGLFRYLIKTRILTLSLRVYPVTISKYPLNESYASVFLKATVPVQYVATDNKYITIIYTIYEMIIMCLLD